MVDMCILSHLDLAFWSNAMHACVELTFCLISYNFTEMQVHCQAQNFTQSFLDYQRLSRVVPASPQVFKQLQQAAHLCQCSQHQMSQVCHDDIPGDELQMHVSFCVSSLFVRSCCNYMSNPTSFDKGISYGVHEEGISSGVYKSLVAALCVSFAFRLATLCTVICLHNIL